MGKMNRWRYVFVGMWFLLGIFFIYRVLADEIILTTALPGGGGGGVGWSLSDTNNPDGDIYATNTISPKTGKVGIGTIAPTGLLQVGNASHASDTVFNQLISTANGNWSGVFSTPPVKISDNTTSYAALRVEPSIYVSSGKTLTDYYGIANTYQGGMNSVGTITNSYGLYIKTPVVGTNKYGAYIEGNVGIGTTAPGAKLDVNNTMVFTLEYSNGNSGASKTIDWNNGNKQNITLTSNPVTLTFSAPSKPANFTLKLVQDTTGNRTAVTWLPSVKWSGGIAPNLSATAGAIDIVTFYYDGSVYYGIANFDFRTS